MRYVLSPAGVLKLMLPVVAIFASWILTNGMFPNSSARLLRPSSSRPIPLRASVKSPPSNNLVFITRSIKSRSNSLRLIVLFSFSKLRRTTPSTSLIVSPSRVIGRLRYAAAASSVRSWPLVSTAFSNTLDAAILLRESSASGENLLAVRSGLYLSSMLLISVASLAIVLSVDGTNWLLMPLVTPSMLLAASVTASIPVVTVFLVAPGRFNQLRKPPAAFTSVRNVSSVLYALIVSSAFLPNALFISFITWELKIPPSLSCAVILASNAATASGSVIFLMSSPSVSSIRCSAPSGSAAFATPNAPWPRVSIAVNAPVPTF